MIIAVARLSVISKSRVLGLEVVVHEHSTIAAAFAALKPVAAQTALHNHLKFALVRIDAAAGGASQRTVKLPAAPSNGRRKS